MTVTASVDSPTVFRQGEVWSIKEYRQQVRTTEARNTAGLTYTMVQPRSRNQDLG